MKFGDLIGQSAWTGRLRSALAAGRIVHAYLICAPAGGGKSLLADLLAQALLCQDPRQGEPCGACHNCRMAASGNHPDLIRLAPEGNSLPVEAIRALQEEMAVQAYLGGRRVVILDQAHRMTPQAQNALLKTLEEPPEGVVLLLLSASAAQLLPTVRSRCQLIQLRPVPDEAGQAALIARGVPAERAALCLRLAGGWLGAAQALAEDEAAQKRRAAAMAKWRAAADWPEAQALLEQVALWSKQDRAELTAMLSTWVSLWRDALALCEGARRIVNLDAAEDLSRAAERAGGASLARILEKTRQTAQSVAGNAQGALALDELLLDIMEEQQTWLW